MRVLTVGNMYPPHHQGGYERMWAAGVEELRARGHDVTVLTTSHREAGETAEDPPWVHRTLGWYWADHAFRRPGPWSAWRLERANAAAFDAVGADADLVMWWAMGGMSLGLLDRARRRRVPSMAVVHDGWPVYGPQVDRWTALTRRARLGAVDHWSFNSVYARDLLARAGVVVDAVRTSVEAPGVDARAFPAAAPPAWGWRLASVGRVEPRKGVATAVRVLAELPRATLEVAGAADPAHERELRALATDLGVEDRVTWLGPVTDPAAVYARADVVLFCVEWAEPFGLVPLEAMSVGRPVVATATGGAAEFLADGVNALLVPPADPGAAAAAVMRLADDAALRERLRAGGADAAARFSLGAFRRAIADRAEDVARRGRG